MKFVKVIIIIYANGGILHFLLKIYYLCSSCLITIYLFLIIYNKSEILQNYHS